ncbi:hypothetical protein HOB76_03420 [Candidatus Woesearchaeota archaeon]|nr:hypothetical protein [Candidatus Woesearchaeota archaeon]
MPRGRPVRSQIRQNVVEILFFMKSGYAYEIYKVYREVFPKATMRVIYYHLKKGSSTGEFAVDRVVREKGDFSWGPEAEKIYYRLGEEAKPKVDERGREYFDKKEVKNG